MQTGAPVAVALVDRLGVDAMAQCAQLLEELHGLAAPRDLRDGLVDGQEARAQGDIATEDAAQGVDVLGGYLSVAPGLGHAGKRGRQRSALDHRTRMRPRLVALAVEPARRTACAVHLPFA